MATECFETRIEEEKQRLADPMNCLSQAAFTLKRVRSDAGTNHGHTLGTCPTPQDADCSSGEEMKFVRALRHRPWINYGKFDESSEDESDSEQAFQDRSSKASLPRGVIRGCSRCDDCQKVSARWRPAEGCRPLLDEAPVFYPSEEEFKDTLNYIASIRKIAEPCGICRIIPPHSWKPPCPLRDKNKWQSTKFPTRVQQVHKLQVRESTSKRSRNANGGRRKKRRYSRMGRSCGRGHLYLSEVDGELFVSDEDCGFGFDSGSEFTLEAFHKYANDFKEQYFGIREVNTNVDCIVQGEMKERWEPSVENIEGEYWRVVEKPTEEIEVLYGADVETGIFGSGFPKSTFGAQPRDAEAYIKSGWNLNNFARLPGSVLSYEGGDISGVLVPWLYLGMCFSSFCWHVEDHHFYSLNYMHWGAPKVWYGIPGIAAVKLEQAMRKHLPDLFDEQPDLLHKLVTQLSPSVLKLEGVPVYRVVQQAGEFVLTFPRAYHAGFNCGFNCAEAVNVAPIDWLPHGQSAVELYREQCRKTSVSHDKLLLGASREAVRSLWELLILKKGNLANLDWRGFCGQDGILTKSLKTRVEMERARRAYLANPERARKMDRNFDATSERECFSCYYDLHLSAVGCECCPERFACLEHAKQLCMCAWSRKFFLYRYDITELDILVEALGGKLNAIYRWATLDLGLALSSYVTKPSTQVESEPRATSLVVNPHQNKRDVKALIGESKASFTSLLNASCRANAGNVMVPSSMQQQDMKLAGCIPAVAGRERGSPQTVHTTEIPVTSLGNNTIPNMDGVCKFEQHEISKRLEGSLQAMNKSIKDESTSECLSHEVSNRQSEPSSYGTKMEDPCLKISEGGAALNSEQENIHGSPILQGNASSFVHSTSTSICQTKSVAGIPGIRGANDRGNWDPEVSHGAHNSPLANGVEYILLSDDEGGEEGDIGSERKAGGRHKCLREGILENDRAAVGVLPKENVCHTTVNDSPRTTEQTIGSTEVSMHSRDQHIVSQPLNTKECKREDIHAKQYDFLRGKDFCVGSSQNGNPNIGLPHPDNPLAQVGASCTFPPIQLQGLLPDGNAIPSRDSVKSNIGDNLTVAGDHHQSQRPYIGTAANSIELNETRGMEFILNHSRNESNAPPVFLTSPSRATVMGSSSRLLQQKGPRIARVVRAQKVRYEVELLNVGVMIACKSWYNNQTIFPKGFRSRVRFYSVLDPTQMCNYVSEVLDAGLMGPLFKVIVEDCLTEVFIHVSIDKCWELVQERLNQEIRRQRSLGKQNLPPLQPPGSLEGLEMFGFTLPSIIQGIEALDCDHRCIEYWATRSSSASQTHFFERSDALKEDKVLESEIGRESNSTILKNLLGVIDNKYESSYIKMQEGESNPENLVSSEKVHMVLKGLFKRASPDELWTMHRVLSSEYGSSNWRAAFKALVEELQKL